MITREELNERIEKVKEGWEDALKVAVEAKKQIALYEELFKSVYDMAYDEADQYSEKVIKIDGVEIKKSSSPTLYNYSEDIVYSQLEKSLKDRKALLSSALKVSDTFFDQDGDEVPKVSIKKQSKANITFSVKE